MPNLEVLYCKNNQFVRKIPNFRKFMIAKIKTLQHLDDRTVFADERRLAEAYIFGDKEKEERKKISEEKEETY
jgi:dynein assembly factor 1